MNTQECEIVRKGTVALCNLIDCFKGLSYRTHAKFHGNDGEEIDPDNVLEFMDAITQADALKVLLRAYNASNPQSGSGEEG